MPLLELRGVTRRFGDFVAVDNVSLSIEQGEFFTLLGPSGCGKTTLLRMIAGFDAPDGGTILFDGRDLLGVPPEKRNLHTVFQSYALFPHMSVAQNIAFPLQMAGAAPDAIRQRTAAALEQVRLPGLGARFPAELSGGQRQRVAVARALINRPRLLLLDEPLAGLSREERAKVKAVIGAIPRETTVVMIEHDMDTALDMADRITVLHYGRVIVEGTRAEVVADPKTREVYLGH
jgi:spermidine/putrescine transport system ATP-binding protein